MNICLISQEYPPETNWGGIATYTRILAKRLTEIGHRVHVISGAVGEETQVNDGTVVVHRVNTRPKSLWAYLFNNKHFQFHPILNLSFRMAEKIEEIHQETPLDIVESPESCAQAIVITLRHRNIPVVTRLHTPHFWVRELNSIAITSQSRRRDFLERLQTRCSKAISAPTRAMADIVQRRWKIKQVDVIPNFFDLKEYEPDVSVYKKHLDGTDYILFFGRLEIRKGVHVLSQAIPTILGEFSQLRIVFAGTDLSYGTTTMRQYIQGNNKSHAERLIFLDNLPHNQLYPVIGNSKLVVLPSLWENFPYACLEAMSFAKTVIATTGSGFGEIIEDSVSGILVKPGDPMALANAVVDILGRQEQDVMGQRAKKRATEFASDKVVPRILEYYNQIVRKVA